MNTLAEMLSSKVRAEFFNILFGLEQNEYHLREIERRSGMAIGTVRQEANKLLKLELIQKRRDGNRVYYKANKEHPLYDIIHNLVLRTNGFIEILRKSLSVDKIKFAFIFGSYAAGKENALSDLDLFIIGDLGLKTLTKLLKKANQKLNREINPHVMTLEEFVVRKDNKDHFVARVLESPKVMLIGEEDELDRLG
jgi:uncharacterized protein